MKEKEPDGGFPEGSRVPAPEKPKATKAVKRPPEDKAVKPDEDK